MIKHNRQSLLFFIISAILLLSQNIFSQVVFRGYPDYKIRTSDNVFFDITETRTILPLNGDWKVSTPGSKDEAQVNVIVPSIFEGDGEFNFEKQFSLSTDQISKNTLKLYLLGLNYTADISINNIIIYRHSGGEYPIEVDLPRDILKSGDDNILLLKLVYNLNSENTIPLKQRFLFPNNLGGIIGDVYIHFKPNVSIIKTQFTTTLGTKKNESQITTSSLIRNNEFKNLPDSLSHLEKFSFRISLIDELGQVIIQSQPHDFTLNRNKEEKISRSLTIEKPNLWEPGTPYQYLLSSELWQGETLVDVTYKTVCFYSFKVTNDSLLFNGKNFQIKGVTYIPSNTIYGQLLPYDQMESDISLIKETGFNTVRFSKCVPHPYLLRLCEQLGLVAFIELPIADVPEAIAQNQNFILRCNEFLTNYISFYSKFSSAKVIGLGNGYLPSLQSHRAILGNIAGFVKANSDLITFASFGNTNLQKIDNLDLYGIELFEKKLSDYSSEVSRLQNDFGFARILISESTYPVSIGNTDGYVNDHSYEAQAKYFEDLIDYGSPEKLSGFFINSFTDYRGDYSSLLSGFSDFNLYNIGIVGEDRSTNRLAYKVIYAKLNNLEKVTIPIGSKKDDAPMVFIIFGLVLAILMGWLVNSGKKFREDASRALLRPYNFFADVRDQRIISAFHTTFLGIVVAAVAALIMANIFFFLKTNIFFEKILLSLGSEGVMKAANYLAWHPMLSLLWLTFAGIFLLLFLSIILKSISLFAGTRVYISSVYFMVIWSFLPLVLLIPIGIILYRVLEANVVNLYVYLVLIAILIWILYRFMKGIYVIFDARPTAVYFYSSLVLILLAGGILFYFEIQNSAVQYLLFTLKQFNILG